MKSVFYYCVEMSRRPFNICFRCIRSNSVRLPHPQVFPPETHQQFFFFSGRGRTDGSRDSSVGIVTRQRAE